MEGIKKVVFITIAVTAFILCLVYYSTFRFFSGNYEKIELKEAKESLSVTAELINNYPETLDKFNREWSQWDETYNFMQTRNKNFPMRNIFAEEFKQIGISYMIFMDKNFEPYYQRGYDESYSRNENVPTSLDDYFMTHKKDFIKENKFEIKRGFSFAGNIPIVFSARPIYNSLGKGEQRGVLIFVKALRKADLKKLLSYNENKVIFISRDIAEENNRVGVGALYSSTRYHVYKESRSLLRAYYTVNDIHEKPAFYIMINMSRNMYNTAMKNQLVFEIFTTLISLIFIILGVLLSRRQLKNYITHKLAVINAIPAMVYIKDTHYRYTDMNDEGLRQYSLKREDIIGKSDFDVFDYENALITRKTDERVIGYGEAVRNIEIKCKGSDGSPRWFSCSKSPLYSANGQIRGIVGFVTETTFLKNMAEKIDYLSYFDTLTMLPNRTLILEKINEIIEADSPESNGFIIFYAGMDGFLKINDTIGRTAGDEVLKFTAKTLVNGLGEDAFVARVGGDEFAVLVKYAGKKDISKYVEYINSLFKESYVYEGKAVRVTLGIGAACYPGCGDTPEEILRNADVAMHAAKKSGKNGFTLYSRELNDTLIERMQIENNLKEAIDGDKLILHYQPQINIDTKEVMGFEALVRWNHDEYGIIPPMKFIPVAEETGIIVEMDRWVMRRACLQAAYWMHKYGKEFKIAVNISARELDDKNLLRDITENLKKSGLPPYLLEIEITEGFLVKNTEKAVKIIKQIKELGVDIALDDFGTGYSSLIYLKQFPIDKIKIDQGFIREMCSSRHDESIVKTIIELGKQLNMSTIAEGVEKHEQMDILKRLGCNEVQGYLFGKPMQAETIEKKFMQQR